MRIYNVVLKDGKYLSRNGGFTTNENLANVYETKEIAEQIARQVDGEAGTITVKSFLR